MIDFYFWTTPNGYKVLMFLEETKPFGKNPYLPQTIIRI
jgi:glutathione S-transferase